MGGQKTAQLSRSVFFCTHHKREQLVDYLYLYVHASLDNKISSYVLERRENILEALFLGITDNEACDLVPCTRV